jgi:hypothetical protein
MAPWEDSKVRVLMEARAGCSALLSAILRDNSLTSPSVHGRFSGPMHLNLLFCPCDAAENSRVPFIALPDGSGRRSSYVGDGHCATEVWFCGFDVEATS